MANGLAYLVFLGWPLVTLVLFRRLPTAMAVSVSVVAGYLLLPGQPTFNFPGLPSLGKTQMLGLSLFVVALASGERHRPVLSGFLPRHGLLLTCAVVLLLVPVGTVLTNGDPVARLTDVQGGLSPYDIVSVTASLLSTILPFLVARRYLADPASHKVVLAVIGAAAVLYSLPALWEVRMSPQLNRQFYGFFPHNWQQHIRDGGFRPLVFLNHGLSLGTFLALGVLAMAASLRIRFADRRERTRMIVLLLFVFGTLALSKNFGATLLAALGAGVILLTNARRWLLVAALVCGTVISYPLLRSAGLVPTDQLVSTLSGIAGPDRIASLEFRLRNEDILLDRANEKPLFGWGRWGRSQVYEDGRRVTTTDGTWIIIYGETGLFGYLALFGIFGLSPILLALRRRRDIEPATAALSLILAVHLCDLLPNSGMT